MKYSEVAIMAKWYKKKIEDGKITIDMVPEKWREQVANLLSSGK